MNIIDILKNLYTNQKADWIINIDDADIQPYVIQRWLAMNDSVRVQARWLDKYVFYLAPKMYLSLAWSVLPKTRQAPFVTYIKKQDDTEEYSFILTKVRKHFKLSDNDYNYVKERIVESIKKDMVNWFSYYGIPKKYWKLHYLNFNLIKDFGNTKKKAQTGLSAWGI